MNRAVFDVESDACGAASINCLLFYQKIDYHNSIRCHSVTSKIAFTVTEK